MDFAPVRTWTLAEANAALPEVRRMLKEAREAQAASRHAQDQLEDLKIVYGDDVDHDGPGHGEWQVHARRLRESRFRLQNAQDAFAKRGLELKDIDLGLVDFFAMRGSELVFLCWKDGETGVRAWHTLEGGFSKRRSIESLTDVRRA